MTAASPGAWDHEVDVLVVGTGAGAMTAALKAHDDGGDVLLIEKTSAHGLLRSVLMVGFLGAFTTFSTFSLQTLALLEEGRLMAAALYTFGSVALCVIATAIGVAVTRAAV